MWLRCSWFSIWMVLVALLYHLKIYKIHFVVFLKWTMFFFSCHLIQVFFSLILIFFSRSCSYSCSYSCSCSCPHFWSFCPGSLSFFFVNAHFLVYVTFLVLVLVFVLDFVLSWQINKMVRSPRNFDAILGLYRTGKLHLSQGVSSLLSFSSKYWVLVLSTEH